jgi:ribonuclease HI
VWTLEVDGASRGNPGPAAAGIVIKDDGHVVLEEGITLGQCTNNQAEYRALIIGLRRARELGIAELTVYTDSQLIANQIAGRWKVKDAELKQLREEALALLSSFEKVDIRQVSRDLNRRADELANEALDRGA